jgi:Flp pilus assembly protein TadG
MVEGVLVLLVIVATLAGTLDFGQVMFVHQALVERTRMAARYAALNPANTTGTRNVVMYGRSDATGNGSGVGYLGIKASNVTITRSGANTNDDRVIVTISNYPLAFFTPWMARAFKGRPISASYPTEAP